MLLQNLSKANFRTKGGREDNQVEDLRRSSSPKGEGSTGMTGVTHVAKHRAAPSNNSGHSLLVHSGLHIYQYSFR